MKKIYLLITSCILYTASYSQWTQIGNDIDGIAAGDKFGYDVSLSDDGSIMAIGAMNNDAAGNNAGQARIYQLVLGSWVQLGASINGEAADDEFGKSVDLSGDGLTVAIGAMLNDGSATNAGHVRVYRYQFGSWVQLGTDIDGEAALDNSGFSVSLNDDGSRVAIGAHFNNGNGSGSGHVRVYEFNLGSWSQLGVDIDGDPSAQSGVSISLSGDGSILGIGSIFGSGVNGVSGHVRVYEWDLGSWTLLGSTIEGEGSSDFFGISIDLSNDGTMLAIGGYNNDGAGANAGHARVYQYGGVNWTQIGNDIDGEAPGDRSGVSVSISENGQRIAVGASGNGDNGTGSGHVRVFDLVSTVWTQLGGDIDGEASGDWSGISTAFNSSGDRIAIGAPYNDGGAVDAGHVRVYEICPATSANINISTCLTYTVPSGDETYTAFGNYTVMDTVMNATGCDSVLTIDLTINNVTAYADTQIACDSYIWIDGNTYASSNSTATYILSNSAGCDSTITLDLTINYSSVGTDTQIVCDSYTWIDGNAYTSSNSTATHVLPNAAGCDSTVTLDLTINTVDASVTESGITLTANTSGATYEWLDCLDNQPIVGETNQSFTATSNGDYAVVVTLNGCSDTSACFTISAVGVIENDFGNAFYVYPNPTNGEFSIDLGNVYQRVNIQLTTMDGRIIQSKTYTESQFVNLELKESTGIYLLFIESDNRRAIVQLIKE